MHPIAMEHAGMVLLGEGRIIHRKFQIRTSRIDRLGDPGHTVANMGSRVYAMK